MAGGTRPNYRAKQVRPVLNRARGLMHELLVAVAPGWEQGFSNVIDWGAPNSVIEAGGDLSGIGANRFFWENAVSDSSYPKTPPNGIGNLGRGIKMLGETDHYRLANASTADKYQSYIVDFGLTVAVTYKPVTVNSDTRFLIIGRRISPFGAANSGWSVGLNAAGGYDASLSDGATEVRASSTTLQSAQRPDLLVMTYDRANLDFWVNGERQARVAGTIAVGNPNRSIRIFDAVTGLGNFTHGVVTMAAIWNRALTQGELNALYADPFVLWRPSENVESPRLAAVAHPENCCCCINSEFMLLMQ